VAAGGVLGLGPLAVHDFAFRFKRRLWPSSELGGRVIGSDNAWIANITTAAGLNRLLVHVCIGI